MSMDRDLEFLYEIGALRYLPRQWDRFNNAGFANLAEHHFRVMWIALILAKHEKVEEAKVLKMALVHDIMESRTGDVDYLARQYVKRNEELGLMDMLAETILAKDEFMKLWKEYSNHATPEAKVVKDADTLDIDIELNEQEARGLKLKYAWQKQRAWVIKNRLYTKTARRMAKAINKSDPNDWHIKARNRLHSGDWKDYQKTVSKTK